MQNRIVQWHNWSNPFPESSGLNPDVTVRFGILNSQRCDKINPFASVLRDYVNIPNTGRYPDMGISLNLWGSIIGHSVLQENPMSAKLQYITKPAFYKSG